MEEAIDKYKYKYQLAWYAMKNNFKNDLYGFLFVDKTLHHNTQKVLYRSNELYSHADELYQAIAHLKTIKHKIITDF